MVKITALILGAGLLFGFVLPYLFSAQTDIGPIIGIVIVSALVAYLVKIGRDEIKKRKKVK